MELNMKIIEASKTKPHNLFSLLKKIKQADLIENKLDLKKLVLSNRA